MCCHLFSVVLSVIAWHLQIPGWFPGVLGWEKGVAGLELEDLLILGVYMAMYIQQIQRYFRLGGMFPNGITWRRFLTFAHHMARMISIPNFCMENVPKSVQLKSPIPFARFFLSCERTKIAQDSGHTLGRTAMLACPATVSRQGCPQSAPPDRAEDPGAQGPTPERAYLGHESEKRHVSTFSWPLGCFTGLTGFMAATVSSVCCPLDVRASGHPSVALEIPSSVDRCAVLAYIVRAAAWTSRRQRSKPSARPKSELLQGNGAVRHGLFPPQVDLRDNHLSSLASRLLGGVSGGSSSGRNKSGDRKACRNLKSSLSHPSGIDEPESQPAAQSEMPPRASATSASLC